MDSKSNVIVSPPGIKAQSEKCRKPECIKVLVDTIIVAILVNMKLINFTFVQYTGNTNGGYFSIIFVVAYFLYITSSVYIRLSQKDGSVQIRKGSVFVIVVLLLWYLFSKHSASSMVQFLCYVIIPIFICSNAIIRPQLLLLLSMSTGILALPVSPELLALSRHNSINMDICYAFLPCTAAAIIYLFSNYKKRNLYVVIGIGTSMYYVLALLLNGMRGTIMCMVVAFLLSFYVLPHNNTGKWTLTRLILPVILVMIVVFFNDIVISLSNYFQSRNINVYFLNKIIRLSEDLSNGRNNVWDITLKGFWQRPIFGHGVNSFEYWTGEIYPHNFFLQFLFEGGLFSIMWLVILIINGTKPVLNNKENIDELIYYVFVFTVSVPYLMVSANAWLTPLLWIYVGVLLRYAQSKEFIKRDEY